jgi:hypothetical protein
MRATVDIPGDIEQWLQRQLRMMAGDDGSCAYFISGNIGSIADYTHDRWQFGVDMIYRCLKSNLILIHNFADCDDEASFFTSIRTLSPFKSEGGLLWNGTLLYGSEMLTTIVEKHFPPSQPYNPDINQAFGEELDEIFQQNGVPWSEIPLLPIA